MERLVRSASTEVDETHRALSNVLARVKDCWASLYGERVLAYRAEQHLAEEPEIAVIIQKMIFSEVSGVMFTARSDQRSPRPGDHRVGVRPG